VSEKLRKKSELEVRDRIGVKNFITVSEQKILGSFAMRKICHNKNDLKWRDLWNDPEQDILGRYGKTARRGKNKYKV
jgi:hypothetical protein